MAKEGVRRERLVRWFGQHRPSRRVMTWLLLAASAFAAALILYAVRISKAAHLYDQQAAGTWSEDGRGVSQLTVFYPVGKLADAFAIRQLEYKLSEELKKESLTDDEGGGASFATAYAAFGSVELMREGRSQPVQARAIGTGGDFFRFHPITLLSGSLYAEDALTPDRVLLDEDLAWQLFGSYNIAGQTLTIGGVAHTVAGVFRIPKTGMIETKAGIPDNLIFLSLASLCQLGKIDGATGAADNGGDAAAIGTANIYGISVWEIVMPDPVKNYAVNLLRTQVKADKEEAFVVENSARFLPSALRARLDGFLTAGMQTKSVVYPYWENIARGYENLFALLWLFQTLLVVFACGVLIVLLFLAWRRRTWSFAGLWRTLLDRKYDLESRMRYAHDKWEHF